MKTPRLQKWLKVLTVTFAVAFVWLFVWANWEPSTITEQLPKIHIASYDLSSLREENSFALINEEFSHKKGITACTVNGKSKVATFTYHPHIISADQILFGLKTLGGQGVSEKSFPEKAGCPVKGTREFFGRIKEFLKVR
ncbi:MAG: hypothetical protein K0R65_1306 [Crocinitomicaceae bacterium]|jgi:hypothetical protein|nr:hypothetical protein [Crocinitomicaceae bacterium]